MTWLTLSSALWLGVLTAISPCPLATNIAAISFIGRQGSHRKAVLASGLCYTLGRTSAYWMLGIVIMTGLLATARVSQLLQKYMNEILGPILILLGMVLLGWIGSGLSINLAGQSVQNRAEKGGLLWSVILGFLFALSFCPVSAGLFFAGLIPLCVQHNSRLVLPMFYGVGTALPVLVFALLLAFAAASVGKAFNKLTVVERWIRILAGVLFVLAGLYYCLTHVYGVLR
ncbi:MAG TPA: aromatic aminobenezylarsenical efflux permease ArsG family transporter [Sedimentisphaerales bacterium]|nr:aromatic aminobenezylarsenical efflux permease ArsG family transporter [Sedimentisphaerales bacterium]HQI28002.1 aromatic aminobenezylarsenical efflux permease ArsG family transporter [Sedimentisphaerales bacterium]